MLRVKVWNGGCDVAVSIAMAMVAATLHQGLWFHVFPVVADAVTGYKTAGLQMLLVVRFFQVVALLAISQCLRWGSNRDISLKCCKCPHRGASEHRKS